MKIASYIKDRDVASLSLEMRRDLEDHVRRVTGPGPVSFSKDFSGALALLAKGALLPMSAKGLSRFDDAVERLSRIRAAPCMETPLTDDLAILGETVLGQAYMACRARIALTRGQGLRVAEICSLTGLGRNVVRRRLEGVGFSQGTGKKEAVPQGLILKAFPEILTRS